jgi:hypothetical protein
MKLFSLIKIVQNKTGVLFYVVKPNLSSFHGLYQRTVFFNFFQVSEPLERYVLVAETLNISINTIETFFRELGKNLAEPMLIRTVM